MRTASLAAASAVAFASLIAAPAQADVNVEGPGAEISKVKQNVIVSGANHDQATIQAKYRCVGTGVHLWASVKQGGTVIDDPAHPSSSATSWYETPEGPAPTCDGKTHVEKFTVTRSTEGDFDQLVKGEGWVQFVFFYVDQGGNLQRAGASGVGQVKSPLK